MATYMHNRCVYIYISFAVYWRISPKIAFFESKICPKFPLIFLFCVSKVFFFLQGEWDFSKKKQKKRRQKITIFWVENLSNYVAQHNWTDFRLNLGQIFGSTILLIFCFFPFSKKLKAQTPNFIGFSAQDNIFCSPPPKLRNTICEHNSANWFFCLSFFCIFVFWVFCCVWFLGGLFWEEWKNKKRQKSKQNNKKESRPQNANNKTT